MLTHCECCRDKRAVMRRQADPLGIVLMGGRQTADLCPACAVQGHGLTQCFLCGERVWVCAQQKHLANRHPRIIERRTNEPDDPPMVVEHKQRYLGRIVPEVLERQEL